LIQGHGAGDQRPQGAELKLDAQAQLVFWKQTGRLNQAAAGAFSNGIHEGLQGGHGA
jgi:hypothetical protein